MGWGVLISVTMVRGQLVGMVFSFNLFDMGCIRELFLLGGTRVQPRLLLALGLHNSCSASLLLFSWGTDDRVHHVPPGFAGE